MKTTVVLTEFIIIGFLSFLMFILSFIIIFPIDFKILLPFFKENQTVIIFMVTLLCYLLGVITHRITQFLITTTSRNYFYKILNKSAFSNKHHVYDDYRNVKFKNFTDDDIITILQSGSESIISRVNYHQSLLRIFKATTLLLPINGILFMIFFAKISYCGIGLFILISCMLLSVSSFLSYTLQYKNLNIFINIFCKKQLENNNNVA